MICVDDGHMFISINTWGVDSIEGKVLDEISNKFVPYKDLYLYMNGLATTPIKSICSDVNGDYKFTNLDLQNNTFMIRSVGFTNKDGYRHRGVLYDNITLSKNGD